MAQIDTISQLKTSSIPICIHYKRGVCRNGSSCRFPHSAPHTKGSSNPCTFFPNGQCRYGSSCRDLHQVSSPPKQQITTPCRFFALGSCKAGSLCKFPHLDAIYTLSTQGSQALGLEDRPGVVSATICKYFSFGNCRRGLDCNFAHTEKAEMSLAAESIDPIPAVAARSLDDEQQQEDTRNPDRINGESFERSFNRCLVRFGDGAIIHSINTPFESRCVILKNISSQCNQTHIHPLIPSGLNLQRIVLDTIASEARLFFETTVDAQSFLTSWTEKQVLGQRVCAELARDALLQGEGSLRSTKVKISWFKPSVLAWAHFNGLSQARSRAQKLNNIQYGGRRIMARFQEPSRKQTQSFSVEINGLPLWVNEEHVRKLSGASKVTMGKQSYDLKIAMSKITECLRDHGHIDTFEIPQSSNSKPKITAFAQYENPDAAAACAQNLHQIPQQFLRGSQLYVENIHSTKYTLPAVLFGILKAPLIALAERYESRCKLRFYEAAEKGDEAAITCVRAYSSDPQSLAKLKLELEQLLEGERAITSGGEGIWLGDMPPLKRQQLCEEFPSAFVKFDERSRQIHLFGDRDVKDRLKRKLVDVSTLGESDSRQISLTKQQLQWLLAHGYKQLQDQLGADRVRLNVLRRVLVIDGPDTDVTAARLHIESYDKAHIISSTSEDDTCPICTCDVVDPQRLPGCGHSYCRECLIHFLRSSPQPMSMVCACIAPINPGKLCDKPIAHSTIQRLLKPEEEERLLRAFFLSYVRTRPNEFAYCPTADCPIIYRPTSTMSSDRIRCPTCLTQICQFCKIRNHEGLTCAQYQSCLRGDELFLQAMAENGIKPCPNCRAPLQKNGGCNHMTCSNCNAHICWVCMGTFGQSEIYEHMKQKHGGIGV